MVQFRVKWIRERGMLYCINTYIVIAWLLPWDTLPSSTLSSKYGQYWHKIFLKKNGDVRNAKLETLKTTKRMGDVHSDFTQLSPL